MRERPSSREAIISAPALIDPDPASDRALPVGSSIAPASAIAIEPSTILSIPEREFFALIEQRPQMMRHLLAGLTLRLMTVNKRIADMTGSAERRAARLFLTLADRTGVTCVWVERRQARTIARSGNFYSVYISPQTAYGQSTTRKVPRLFSRSELSRIRRTHSS